MDCEVPPFVDCHLGEQQQQQLFLLPSGQLHYILLPMKSVEARKGICELMLAAQPLGYEILLIRTRDSIILTLMREKRYDV